MGYKGYIRIYVYIYGLFALQSTFSTKLTDMACHYGFYEALCQTTKGTPISTLNDPLVTLMTHRSTDSGSHQDARED